MKFFVYIFGMCMFGLIVFFLTIRLYPEWILYRQNIIQQTELGRIEHDRKVLEMLK